MQNTEETLFRLIAAGLGETNDCGLPVYVDWQNVWRMASRHGIAAICLDGMQKLNANTTLPNHIKLQWIASTLKQEQLYRAQWKAAASLADVWHKAGMQTYVMKGFVLAAMYPRPKHRYSCDMDCFLVKLHGCCGEKGDAVVESKGIKVDRSYYKNSKFSFKGLTVENHRYLLPIKGSTKVKRFEKWLRTQIETADPTYIEGSFLQTPSEMFNAVYILAHAQEHFFEKGIMLRHVCDWAMLMKAYADKVDWDEWKRICQDNGTLSFGYALSRLANRICGVEIPFECVREDEADRQLLNDILYNEKNSNTRRSDWQVRIDLVRNILKNNWKYRMFSNTNFLMFCGRRVWGYLFDNNLE